MAEDEEESQGNNARIFSVRIVSIDYYMSPPIPDFDISYSSFQGGSVKEVPVIRIFGSTPAGQKACVHVHRALPYLYVACSEIPLQIKQEGIGYENAICLAVERALKLKGHAGSKRQHVHGCSVVRARKFYGYHPTEELFIKLYLYHPPDISRAASLLLDGAVFERSVQPYEAHIPFLLQYMVDYNLYGMGHMHLLKMRFRHPVPDGLCIMGPEQSSRENADASAVSSSSHFLWRSSTIMDDWMWPYPTESGASSNQVNSIVKRQSTCELEGDSTVDDILNQQLKMYTSLSQTHSDVRMVQSLVPIWEEEFERSGVHEAEILADPGKPLPEDVLRTISNTVEYEEKLRELYHKIESTLSTQPEDTKAVVAAQCFVEERRSDRFGTQNSDEPALRSSEEINIGQSMGPNPEDVALLKWLASSQVAEEINSDDELHRETILSPLVPAGTLDKVLEKANTDFESESQQECQDILDSVLDILNCDEHIDKASSSVQDKVSLPGTTIPQLDGSGDNQLSTPAAIKEKVIEMTSSKRRGLSHGNTTSDNKRKGHEIQWGSLPFSEVRQIGDGILPGSTSMSASGKSTGRTNDGALLHSSVRDDIQCNTAPSSKNDSGRLLGCSVRDLMGKKRCLRVKSSKLGDSEAEEDSKKENTSLIPMKLDFDIEQSEAQKDAEFYLSEQGQTNKQTELCDTWRISSLISCQREKKTHASLLISGEEKETDSLMPSPKSPISCLKASDTVTDSACLKSFDGNSIIRDGTSGHHAAACSSSLPSCEGLGKLCLPGVAKCGNDLDKVGSIGNYASCPPEEEVGHTFDCIQNEGPSEYVSMTFHKRPPVVNWRNGASEDTPLIGDQTNCCIADDDSEYEGNSAQGNSLEDVVPFFVDSREDVSKQTSGICNLFQNSALGAPLHYRNDGSFAYVLTRAVSPPSVNSVHKWLAAKDKEKLLKKPPPEYSYEVPHSNQSPLKLINSLLDQGDHINENIEGGLIGDLPSSWSNEKSPESVKEAAKFSQDISQISGPSGQSKPTPLSQIGFRDPATIGAGQQLTLLSIEVQAQCRGDLRPNPQHDAINIIALAVQSDNSPSVDIHVLLRGELKACRRNVDGLSQYKVLVFPDEMDLIDQFIITIRSLDPDILIGWDVQGSSLGFLAERASCLGVALLDKISRTPSETKATKKDPEFFDKDNNDSASSDTLISHDNTVIEDEWGRTHASGVHVTGRIVLNVWRLVRSEVKLNMYTLEAVAEAVLRRKVPSVHWKVLNKWFLSGPGQARFLCVDYVVERAKLNLEIVDQLDMVTRTSELARVFGIDFFSVLSRGSQYRVESMLVRLAHTQNYVLISPGYHQVASQPAMECIPLVMEPESGFYSDPVIVLDFQSLYPSMIIAYNLCFSTCCGNVASSKANTLGVSSYAPDLHILKDQNLQMLVTPNGVMYVPSKVRKGVLPRLLEEILSTRIMVKKAMKRLGVSQQILNRIFNSRQLALKLIANVTYGYTAAGFSGRMPCAELADSIVQCGRRTLEHAISFVNMHDEWNARVIYGDTDSLFVLLKGRTMKEAFQIGSEIASKISAMNPYPVTLKMEKVYQSCFLLTKKRYVGYSYETVDQPQPIFDAKGIETVRRDTCVAVAKTLEKSLRMFFEHRDILKVRVYLQRQWSRILSGRIPIQDFIFAKEVRLGTYSVRTASLPPAAIVASKAMRADPRAEPRYAERVPYVVVHGEPGARLVDMVVDPHELLAIDSPYRLNDLYYITKQIIPALQRVFGLLGADLSQWFQEMPRQVRDAPTKHHFNAVNSVRARIDHYYSSSHCVLCGELAQSASRLCANCLNKGPVTAAAMTGRTAKLERDIQHLVAICRHCGGGDWVVESGVKCTSLACSVYYERVKVQKELRAFSTIANEAGFYPKCMVEWF